MAVICCKCRGSTWGWQRFFFFLPCPVAFSLTKACNGWCGLCILAGHSSLTGGLHWVMKWGQLLNAQRAGHNVCARRPCGERVGGLQHLKRVYIPVCILSHNSHDCPPKNPMLCPSVLKVSCPLHRDTVHTGIGGEIMITKPIFNPVVQTCPTNLTNGSLTDEFCSLIHQCDACSHTARQSVIFPMCSWGHTYMHGLLFCWGTSLSVGLVSMWGVLLRSAARQFGSAECRLRLCLIKSRAILVTSRSQWKL